MRNHRKSTKYKNAGKFLMKRPKNAPTNKLPWNWDDAPTKRLNLGKPDVECPHCKAILWTRETQYEGKKVIEKFSLCCNKGKYILNELPNPPKVLKDLYEDFTTEEGKYFHKHIRQLNCALSMAWMDCDQVKFKSGIPVFKIHGQMHNKVPPVAPLDGMAPAWAQIYILDPRLQTEERLKRNGIVGKNGQYRRIATKILTKLQHMLMNCNGFIQKYRNAFTEAKTQVIPEVVIHLKQGKQNAPNRTYNTATCDEIAALIPTGGQPGYVERGICIGYKTGGLLRIPETHCAYEALQYPLLYPKATPSWPQNVKYQKEGLYILDFTLYNMHCLIFIYRNRVTNGLLFI